MMFGINIDVIIADTVSSLIYSNFLLETKLEPFL